MGEDLGEKIDNLTEGLNNFKKGVRKSVLTGVIVGATFWTSWMYGINYYTKHNVVEEYEGGVKASKMDGMWGHTDIDYVDGKIRTVNRFSFWGTTRDYQDTDGDGVVDRVHLMPGNLFSRGGRMDRVYYLDEHLDQYPEVFTKAQNDVDEQDTRFKDLL